MVVVFSVNGALATYSIEFLNAAHAIAKLARNEEDRKDIPEIVEFFKVKGSWNSTVSSEAIKKSILHALNHPTAWDKIE